MSKILVVDDMPFCREPIAEALRLHGHEVLCANDGLEALTLIRDQRPDLVLLDVNMPGMDGLTTLRTIRRNPDSNALPVLLLTEQSERETILDAAKSGVQGYILKSSFKLSEMLARIDECLSCGTHSISPSASTKTEPATRTRSAAIASPKPALRGEPSKKAGGTAVQEQTRVKGAVRASGDQRPVLTGQALLAHISKDLDLRPLAATVQNVMAVASSPGCSADDVAHAAGKDQALCIRLLKLAHSSAYARGRPVANVKEAVQRLGVQEVRNLVMTLDVLEMYSAAQQSSIDYPLFWEHSIACGLIAGAIAKACHVKSAEDCFVWGILHDVGRLILVNHVPDQYVDVCESARNKAQPLEKAEGEGLRLDHCDVLGKALEQWRFPRDFIVPVASHHLSVQRLERLAPQHREAAAIVALANRLAHALLLGSSGNETIYPLGELVDRLRLPDSTIDQIAETVPAEVNDLKVTMLARSDAQSWPSFAVQIQSRLDAEVRPLIVGSSTEVDAYRFFFERISNAADSQAPNLAVVYLQDTRKQEETIAKLELNEREKGITGTPILLIHNGNTVHADSALLRGRKHRIVIEPVCMTNLLSAVGDLVSAGNAR